MIWLHIRSHARNDRGSTPGWHDYEAGFTLHRAIRISGIPKSNESCINICICSCEWLIYTVLLLFWNKAGHSYLFLYRFNKTPRSFLLNVNNFAYVYMSWAHDVRVVSGRWLLKKSSSPNDNFALVPTPKQVSKTQSMGLSTINFHHPWKWEAMDLGVGTGNRGRAVILFLKVCGGTCNIHFICNTFDIYRTLQKQCKELKS